MPKRDPRETRKGPVPLDYGKNIEENNLKIKNYFSLDLEENLTIYINNELCPLCGAPMTDKNHLDLELLNTKIEAMKSEQTKLVTEIQIKEGQVTKLAGEIQAMGYDPANLDNEIKKVEDSLVAFEQEATLYLKEIEQL